MVDHCDDDNFDGVLFAGAISITRNAAHTRIIFVQAVVSNTHTLREMRVPGRLMVRGHTGALATDQVLALQGQYAAGERARERESERESGCAKALP